MTFAAVTLTLESVTLPLLVIVTVATKLPLNTKLLNEAATLKMGVKPFSVAVPITPPLIAEMTAPPAPTTCASPGATILATPVFDDVQTTDVVITRVVPSL
jgi:hypothetical protein